MLKTALAAAKQVCGAELEIIRLQDLKLRDCIGCETCMRGLTTGGDGLCVVRDDDMPLVLRRREGGGRAHPCHPPSTT
ncbi:MAG: hypothetical protein ACLU9S_05400 [Oscillospiraceae bacterium]